MDGVVECSPNLIFENQNPSPADNYAELVNGLSQSQKTINPKYFYDKKGSELFEDITRLPEYYPTRTEKRIFSQYAKEIAEYCGKGCVLIEPGSGNSEKVRLLLDAISPSTYIPLDISAEFLRDAAEQLSDEFPWLNIHAICADFAENWQVPSNIPNQKRVIFYPGSTIGNMEPKDAEAFLSEIKQLIGNDGGVLIGVDMHKEQDVLHAAYNDKQGVTAQFNLNVLNSVNDILSADFNSAHFRHEAFYDSDKQRIEMHLVSTQQQAVNVRDKTFEFGEGESIHTESSYKYTVEGFAELAQRAGFQIKQSWLDDDQLFSVHYLEQR